MNDLNKTLNFISEIEKLKTILRKTKPIGLNRYENSAEHSWHVCISALLLKEFSNEPVDICHVIKLLLVHDLGEIYAGDTIVYETNSKSAACEHEALKKLLAELPEDTALELEQLWSEFEAGDSAEAQFAKALDRTLPLLQNLASDGHSWKQHDIPKEKVFAVNKSIKLGSLELWREMEKRLNLAVTSGILN